MKIGVLVVAMAVVMAPCSAVAEPQHPGHVASGGSKTVDLQGGRMDCSNEMVVGFYDISRKAFAGGADKVDLEAYKQKTFAFMRETIARHGGSEEDAAGWVDHVKDIPRQMIGIVKDDPRVLDSCEKFSVALSGPA